MPTTNHTEMTDFVATRKVAPSRAAVQTWRAASHSCSVTQGFLYAPFGEIISEYQGIAPSSALPKYAFNAKELDEETGMYYYEARYYNPPVFTSRDPMFEQKPWLTPYHYCSNNPVGRVDPTGMMDGDYIDLDGNYLGNDGKADGKTYVVTDRNEVNRINLMQNDNCGDFIENVCSAIDLTVSNEIRNEIVEGIYAKEKENSLCEYGGIVRNSTQYENGEYRDKMIIDWGVGKQWEGQGHNAEFDYNSCSKNGTPMLIYHSHFPGKDKNGIGVIQTPSLADLYNASNDPQRKGRLNVVFSTKNEIAYLLSKGQYYEMNICAFRGIFTNMRVPSN